jgi:hypothetical protein
MLAGYLSHVTASHDFPNQDVGLPSVLIAIALEPEMINVGILKSLGETAVMQSKAATTSQAIAPLTALPPIHWADTPQPSPVLCAPALAQGLRYHSVDSLLSS